MAAQHTRARVFGVPRPHAVFVPRLGFLASVAACRLHDRACLKVPSQQGRRKPEVLPFGALARLLAVTSLHYGFELTFAFACRRHLDCVLCLSCRCLGYAPSPRGGPSGLRLPFCGSSCTYLPSCSNPSTLCLATPCAQGTYASDLAAMALSASPAGSTPEVPSAKAGAGLTTGDSTPSSCVVTPAVRLPPRLRSRPRQQARWIQGFKPTMEFGGAPPACCPRAVCQCRFSLKQHC